MRDNPGVRGSSADSPFEELCGVHIGQAWGMASRLTTCSADADDVMQDALVVAWTKRAMIPPEPWPWFCAVITNCARNHQRKNARVKPMPYIDPDSRSDSAAHPARALQADELRAELQAAISELSPEEHEVVALCVLGGLTQQEASKATGVNINTVKARVRRGTERLREKLKHRPSGVEAFLALPAFPLPSGGLERAVSRWVSVAKNGGPISYLPRLTIPQLAVAGCLLVAFIVAVVVLALNPPGADSETEKVTGAELIEPLPEPPDQPDQQTAAPDGPHQPARPGANQEAVDIAAGGAGHTFPDSHPDAPDETAVPVKPEESDQLLYMSDKYPSGELRSEGTVLKTADGYFVHGHWKYYYRDGTLQDEGEYIRGSKQGTWKKYHQNTVCASQGTFVDDQKHGLWEYFRPDGSLLVRGECFRGEKNGTWTGYFASGNICETTVWQHNARNGWRRRYDGAGRLILDTAFADNRKNGQEIEYDPATRRPRKETSYFNGLKHGLAVVYDPATGYVMESDLYWFGVLQDD